MSSRCGRLSPSSNSSQFPTVLRLPVDPGYGMFFGRCIKTVRKWKLSFLLHLTKGRYILKGNASGISVSRGGSDIPANGNHLT